MLNRKWTSNPAVERGMAFEDALCNKKLEKYEIDADLTDKFNAAYEEIHSPDSNFQAKAKKFVMFDNKEFILYGKIDVKLPNKIIDIKTTGNYRGQGSYLSGWQHKVYCLCEKIADFEYIVFEFNNLGLLTDVHRISYHVYSFAELEKEVMDKLKSVVEFLRKDNKLKVAYMKVFNMYN